MQEKKVSWRDNPLWSISGFWNNLCSFLWKPTLAKIPYISVNDNSGFTLIELLVVIGMLAILFTVLVGVFNPLEQYNKSTDAKRQSDLNQVKTALDSYFNDTGCYPQTVPFGGAWTSNNSVYFKKTPEDPQCGSSGDCYLYQTDGSSCPQWNVLYGAMRSKGIAASTNKVLCPLEQIIVNGQPCIPTNYGAQTGYDYCVVSGTVSCAYITANVLPAPNSQAGASNPTPSPVTAASCQGVDPSSQNYMRYKCNGTCQDAGKGNGYYCVSTCENKCPQ